jgi:sugar phosphate isomerase/epimerase
MKALTLHFAILALATSLASASEPIPAEHRINGFALGCQAYTFNKFTAFEAIEKTAASGAKVIEFYPGQKLSPEFPDLKLHHDATPETIEKIKAKLKEHGLIAVAYGVVGLSKDEAASRKVFEFARTLGIRVINTESIDAIDTFEKLAMEYDIKVGIHEHPKREKDPSYMLWDPNFVLGLVKDRDPRIGACADTGHWMRSGLNPLECVRILKGRIVSSHLKDLSEASLVGHDMPYGTGQSDINAILKEYVAQGFDGPISIEYEYDWYESLPQVTKCVEYVKAWKP